MPTNKQIQIPVKEFDPHRWMLDVLSSPARFKVLRWHRRARKTTLGLNILIRAAASNHGHTYVYVAPTYKQAKAIIVRDPMMLSRYLPREVLTRSFNESELWGRFITGSNLVIKGSDDPDSLRGLNANGVFFDEWAQCKPEAYGEIFRPILAQNGGWAMFGFTPKGRNHAYEFWRRGCVADSEWKSFDLLASTSGLIKDDELAKARVEMGEALYSQEMECEFLADAASVFGGLDECVVGSLEDSVPGHAYVIGVDLGRHHDATVLTCMDRMRRHVVAYVRLTENHWALQKTAIAELARRYNNALCVVEENSFGSPIIEDLREMGVSVQGFKTTSASKGGLIDGLRVAIAQRQVTFPRIEQMLRELQEYEIEITPLGNIRYHAPEGEGYFDDSVMSLALCVSGLGAERYAPRYDDVAYDLASFEVPVNGGYWF